MAIMIAIALVLVLVLIFTLYIGYRNELVCRERIRIVNEVYKLGKKHLENDEDMEYFVKDYCSKLDNYSYNKMMWQLFKFHWTLKDFNIREI